MSSLYHLSNRDVCRHPEKFFFVIQVDSHVNISYIFNQLSSLVNLGKVVLVITLGRITSFTASSSRSTLSAVLLNLISDKLQHLFYLEPCLTNLWPLCLMQTQSHLPWPWPNSWPSLCSINIKNRLIKSM